MSTLGSGKKRSFLSVIGLVLCCLAGSYLSGMASVQGMVMAGAKLPSDGGGSFDLAPLVYFLIGCFGGLVFSSFSVVVLALRYRQTNRWAIFSALILTPVLAGIISAICFSASR